MKVESKQELREIIGLKELIIRELVEEGNRLEKHNKSWMKTYLKKHDEFEKYKRTVNEISQWYIVLPVIGLLALGYLVGVYI